jgi:hypothetical protein
VCHHGESDLGSLRALQVGLIVLSVGWQRQVGLTTGEVAAAARSGFWRRWKAREAAARSGGGRSKAVGTTASSEGGRSKPLEARSRRLWMQELEGSGGKEGRCGGEGKLRRRLVDGSWRQEGSSGGGSKLWRARFAEQGELFLRARIG